MNGHASTSHHAAVACHTEMALVLLPLNGRDKRGGPRHCFVVGLTMPMTAIQDRDKSVRQSSEGVFMRLAEAESQQR